MRNWTVLIALLLLMFFSRCQTCSHSGREQIARRNDSSVTSRHSERKEKRTMTRTHDNPVVTSPTIAGSTKTMDGSEIFEKYNSAVFMVYTSNGWNDYQGSGFFISDDGVAVSNYHVFQGTSIGYEKIKMSDGRICKIEEVIAKNSDDDIIVFRVKSGGRKFNCVPIAKQSPKVGEKVFAIGSPRGLENTFSSGEISQIRDNNYLQISVPIDHGSSGGVLLNTKGEAVGITSAGLDSSGANLNFAIDIKVLRKYVRFSN